MTSERRPWHRAVTAAVSSLLLLLGSAGCGAFGDQAVELEPYVEDLVVDGQPAIALVPGVAEPRGLVIYLHGFGGDHESLRNGDQIGIAQRLVDDGYVVAASDAHLDGFGNIDSQQAYVELAEQLRERHSTSRTYLLAESMGTVAALQIVAGNRITDLVGMAAICGLIDLDTAVGTEFEDFLRQAYGGRLPIGAENPAQIPASSFAGSHLRFYVTKGDELVVTDENVEPFVARVQDVADVSVVQCSGGHVDATCFQPDDVADWFDALTA